MDDSISVAAISAMKLQQASEQVQVSVFKKASEQREAVLMTLISSAVTPRALPDGVGQQLNITA